MLKVSGVEGWNQKNVIRPGHIILGICSYSSTCTGPSPYYVLDPNHNVCSIDQPLSLSNLKADTQYDVTTFTQLILCAKFT